MLVRWQFRLVHRLLDLAVDQLPDARDDRRPACVSFARAVLGEDLSVNGVLAAGQPLVLPNWAGRTGISELPPFFAPAGPGSPRNRGGGVRISRGGGPWEWRRRVRLDLERLRPHARAVYTSTDAYVAALSDDQLEPLRGETPGCLFSALLLTLATRRAEIVSLLPN